MEFKYTTKQLLELQNRPLEEQYNTAVTRIIDAIKVTLGDIMVSFSGGKDSALLLDMYCEIASKLFGIKDVFVGYADTTNETKSMRQYVPWFVDRCEKKYGVKIHITTTRPKNNVTFASVVKEKGIPFISKQTAGMIRKTKESMKAAGIPYDDVIKLAKPTISARDALLDMGFSNSAILALTGWSRPKNDFGKAFTLAKQWLPLLNCDIPLTERCCSILKEEPLAMLGYKNVMTGEQANESKNRENEWLKNGCNYYIPSGGYKSKPFGSLSAQAILYSIHYRKIPLSPDYGEVICCGDCFKCTKASRTGCALCGFGIKFNPDRFVRLQETEPAKIAWAFKPRAEGGAGYRELCEYSNEYCGTKILIPR